MSNNGNLLQITFDCVWGIGENIYKLFQKRKEPVEAPLDIFFKKAGLCNRDQEYPKVIETIVNNDEHVYKLSCPIGIGKRDFEKYEDALEAYLGKKIYIELSRGFIYIK